MEEKIIYSTPIVNVEQTPTPQNEGVSLKNLFGALSKAQAEFGKIVKNKVNPYYRSKYADLETIISAVQPALTKYGLTIIQRIIPDLEYARVETILGHTSGECIKSEIIFKPEKNVPQAFGSAYTYARRYSLSAMLNISAEDDDDANDTMITPNDRIAEFIRCSEVKEVEELFNELKELKHIDIQRLVAMKNKRIKELKERSAKNG